MKKLFAVLALITVACVGQRDFITDPEVLDDLETMVAATNATTRSLHPTIVEGGQAHTYWLECPAAMEGVHCYMGEKFATLVSKDDNLVEGDRNFSRGLVLIDPPSSDRGRGSVDITVLDDDTAYVSFRSRSTGHSWTKNANYNTARFWARLVCEDWHELTSNPNFIPSLCSRDYEHIWRYLGGQSGRYPCSSAASIIAYAESTRRSAAFNKMIAAFKPQYRRGCYTFSQTKEWFVSLSKPVQMTAATKPSAAAWVQPDYWHLVVTRTNHFRMPMTNYRAEDGDWRLSDLVRSDTRAAEYTGADRCGDMTTLIKTYTHGLNDAQAQFVNTSQIVVDIPDGADICNP